jgi:hypothetical protein
VLCLDLDGREVWKHALEPRRTRFAWGTAGSPVLHGDRLFYVCDNDEQSYLLALDKRTGRPSARASIMAVIYTKLGLSPAHSMSP